MSGVAQQTNANLVNPWGIVATDSSKFEVAINGTGNALQLNTHGSVTGQTIVVPPPAGSPAGTTAAPSGEVVNSDAGDFMVSEGKRRGAATFLFATEDGTISGFNSRVDKSNAILAVDDSAQGDVFKGLALGRAGNHDYLYATDFHNGVIDVFDRNFSAHTFFAGQFTDPHPVAGFAPFGITDINGTLFVSYAKQDAAMHDDVAGVGNGFIDAYSTNGHFLARIITGTGAGGTNTDLNSPWPMVMAPGGFGRFGGDLLVGNFGDSHVTAINVSHLHAAVDVGQLDDTHGNPLVLTGGVMGTDFTGDTKGLWGLSLGRDGSHNTLFFTSGINDENDGLFGTVTVAPQKAHMNSASAAAASMNASDMNNKNEAIDAVMQTLNMHMRM
jgi:uncharacterized protein (TIGR03118 family)